MIDKIGDRCTGCAACANKCPKQCIHMRENKEGFLYPEIDANHCINCDLCEKACPVLTPIPINKTEKDVKVYAVTHKDELIRANSSSGGVFTAIAEYVVLQGGVVFGAAFNERWDVEHICVDNLKDLQRLRGSKYVQSRIGNTYQQAKEFLQAGRLVLFSGTPCQTSGLIGYLGRKYDNLITQDLICASIPSPMVWRRYLRYREQMERSKIEKVSFRDKIGGWHSYHLSILFENGTVYAKSQMDDMMMKAFLYRRCSRKCCYHCEFKQKYRLADFTLADYWGIQDIAPELDDNRGLSSCYVNSPKAADILEKINSQINLQEMDLETAVSKNMAMVTSAEEPDDRSAFLSEIRRRPFDVVVGKYILHTNTREKILGSLRRIMGNRTYDGIKAIIRRR